MKVLMTADAVGGVWNYALELASGLAARDVEVHLRTMGCAPRRDQLRRLAPSGVAGFEHGDFALEWQDDPWVDVERAGEWLLDAAEALSPDVVHLNGYAHGVLPWDLPVVVVGHSCVLSWHDAVRGGTSSAHTGAYCDAVRLGIRGADALVAPTTAMLAALERLYAPSSPTIVIPNGREAAAFAPRAKEPFVAGVGRLWDEAKNLETLDRAAAALPWPVLLAGDSGGRRCSAARLLGELPPDATAALLARASVFAAPARYEPFGLAALEAGLSGCALVLGDISSLREVWGDAAAFVPPDDAEALAYAVLRLIASPPMCRAAALRARRRALRYDSASMTDGYVRLYRRLVRERAPAQATATEVTA
jgi:glycosyltransferase involved in cell wall biosynthesis